MPLLEKKVPGARTNSGRAQDVRQTVSLPGLPQQSYWEAVILKAEATAN